MRVFIGFGLLFACSCVSLDVYQRRSAGFVGCRPDDITVEKQESDGLGTATWEAVCKNERYMCSQVGASVSCKKL